MTINVSEALDSDTAKVATLIDKNGGGYVDGLFVEASETTRKAMVSFQQPTPAQLQFLDGGERKNDLKAMYSNKELFLSNDGDSATEVVHRGVRYKMVFVGDWNDYGFMFGIGARIS